MTKKNEWTERLHRSQSSFKSCENGGSDQKGSRTEVLSHGKRQEHRMRTARSVFLS